MVFLLQVMRSAKLNKPPPLSIKPPSKVLEKNKPPGVLIEDLRYVLGGINKLLPDANDLTFHTINLIRAIIAYYPWITDV